VITAVNIQHIESLNDAIASTTGVRVRETIPDWVLKRADEVVNVDVSVETLRARLRQGKIYDEAKIEQALTNFFRTGNLTALRELALRQLASDQAGKAQEYRQREGLDRPVIPEKVMVAMASRGSAHTLLRVGSRIAGRLATDWYAVYVETPREEPGRIKPDDHVALSDNIRFAKQLGAKVVKLKGSRVSDALRSLPGARASRTSSSGSPPDRGGICWSTDRSSIVSSAMSATRRCRLSRSRMKMMPKTRSPKSKPR
jgi:two-component system sensor histidine kinase KdpD